MKEEYVTYEQAVALKECGFDWECYTFWSKNFCTDGTPVKIRKTKSEPKMCIMSERNSVLDDIDSDLITAPTQALAQKWLREIYGLHIQVRINGIRDMFSVEIWEMKTNGYSKRLEQGDGHVRLFDTYESALSAGIDAALELIKQK